MKCEIIETIFIASLVIFVQNQVSADFLEPRCGALRISKRVVNGTDAVKGLYPWMAFIHHGKSLICGGTLISHWFILSAAHCITEPEGLTVSLGVYNNSDLDPSRLYQVKRFFKHWSYVRAIKGNDIGLLKLARKVGFSALVRPICILTKSKIKVEQLDWFWAIGWGDNSIDGKKNPILQKKIIKRTDKSECDCLDSQICTMSESGTVCFGDSGGPLVRVIGKRFIQLGVSSYVKDHCRARAIFTNIRKHTDWIQFVVGEYTP